MHKYHHDDDVDDQIAEDKEKCNDLGDDEGQVNEDRDDDNINDIDYNEPDKNSYFRTRHL